jgi:hypothetical protein
MGVEPWAGGGEEGEQGEGDLVVVGGEGQGRGEVEVLGPVAF